jgi:hypothetical protein
MAPPNFPEIISLRTESILATASAGSELAVCGFGTNVTTLS